MKLPFDFGIKLIFRLVFPGAIVAAALVPAVHSSLRALGISIKFEYLFPIEVVAWGWAIVISDMYIYMLFEGRRFWPSALRGLLMCCQKRRLRRLRQIAFNKKIDRRRSLEASVEYGLYPIDEDSAPYVAHPTRLGNIIASFETYPNVKYGLDAVFYWYRLWVVLDKDLREEIDSSQAVADSAMYVSFALYLSALVALIYAAIVGAPQLRWSYLSWLSAIDLLYVPPAGGLCIIAAVCFVFGLAVYRLSLPAHAQFGELFKSVFDQYRSKLEFSDVLEEVVRVTGNPLLISKSQREKNSIVWRYLRWHFIRDDGTRSNLTVKQWEDRKEARTDGE